MNKNTYQMLTSSIAVVGISVLLSSCNHFGMGSYDNGRHDYYTTPHASYGHINKAYHHGHKKMIGAEYHDIKRDGKHVHSNVKAHTNAMNDANTATATMTSSGKTVVHHGSANSSQVPLNAPTVGQ